MKRSTLLHLSKNFRFQWEEAQQCFVLLYPEGMIQLNPSGGEILRRCQHVTTIDAVVTDLEQCFPKTEGLAEDVIAFFEEAIREGWLDIVGQEGQEAT